MSTPPLDQGACAVNKTKKVKLGDPAKADSTLPSNAPFSKQDLDTTLKVVCELAKDKDLFNSAACRELRKCMEPLVKWQIERRGVEVGGKRESAKGSTVDFRSRSAREQHRKSRDRELIENRTLRLQRLNQLKAMVELDPRVPLVPDGAVFDGFNASAGQTQGTSSCVASIQNSTSNPTIQNQQEQQGDEHNDDDDKDELWNSRACYVCKCRFYKLHHFYASLCIECAELNWQKRMQTRDLTGKWALLTGGRVKVGYHIMLKLLRAGATVVMTTRFPTDAAERLSREHDFASFQDRIKLFGIDFRDLVAVEHLCERLNATLPRLDIIINNACQTIRRPPAYYRHLVDHERNYSRFSNLIMDGSAHGLAKRDLLLIGNDANTRTALPDAPLVHKSNKAEILPADLTQLPLLASDTTDDSETLFPSQAYDVNAQQIDLRDKTSWTLKLHEISTPEAVEVLAVNSLSPMIISSRLKQLLVRTRDMDLAQGLKDDGRYIVNVSSMEGKFNRRKDGYHVHTNMAKASLNMLTRTSGMEYVKDNIYMTAVDTGWLSIEAPAQKAAELVERNKFQTPIDEVDGASRCLDPIFSGMAAEKDSDRLFAVFLKDYRLSEW